MMTIKKSIVLLASLFLYRIFFPFYQGTNKDKKKFIEYIHILPLEDFDFVYLFYHSSFIVFSPIFSKRDKIPSIKNV